MPLGVSWMGSVVLACETGHISLDFEDFGSGIALVCLLLQIPLNLRTLQLSYR